MDSVGKYWEGNIDVDTIWLWYISPIGGPIIFDGVIERGEYA